jgi:hypothetical protein
LPVLLADLLFAAVVFFTLGGYVPNRTEPAGLRRKKRLRRRKGCVPDSFSWHSVAALTTHQTAIVSGVLPAAAANIFDNELLSQLWTVKSISTSSTALVDATFTIHIQASHSYTSISLLHIASIFLSVLLFFMWALTPSEFDQ